MEPRLAQRLTSDVLAEVTARFGIGPDDLDTLGGFESFMYEYRRDGEPAILRVSHVERFALEGILGELDFLAHLRRGGARVAGPLPSPGGNLVEVVDDRAGSAFACTAFEKAPGGHLPKPWGDSFVRHYGSVVGALHRLSEPYEPSDPSWSRPRWDAPSETAHVPFLRSHDGEVAAIHDATAARIVAVPEGTGTVGLIHGDAHAGNFFVEDGLITLFDFADCIHSRFVHDVAMVVFYAVVPFEEDPEDFTRWFLPLFLQGYRGERPLDGEELGLVGDYLKLREIDLYAILERDTDWRAPDAHGWDRALMTGRRERIVAGAPVVDLDFSTF